MTLSLSPLHFTITKTLNKPHSTTDLHHSSRQSIGSEEKGRGADSGDVSRFTSTPAEFTTFDATAKYWQRTKQARNFNM
jgi:hypothetical protein